MRPRPPSRPATSSVEFALVGSVTFLLLIGLIVGGIGMFRYQQVARLARDASRWASVHGTQYAATTGNAAATQTDVYNQIIVPYATLLDLTKLTPNVGPTPWVTWNQSNSPYHTTTVNGTTTNVANTVTVKITYQWIPEALLGGVTMSSTSVTVMSF